MAPYLESEIRALGYAYMRVSKTAIELKGYDVGLHTAEPEPSLRWTGFVLTGKFTARNADQLYGHLRQMEWEDLIPADSYFSITSFVRNETITNQLFANVKVKDAIADRFREKEGKGRIRALTCLPLSSTCIG